MSDTVTTARRWNSFVCPGCRCVFRVPRDHDGTGVVCPACRVMLRLPGPDDAVPPLVTPPVALATGVEDEDEHLDDGEEVEDAGGSRGDRHFIALLAVVSVLLVGLVTWAMLPDQKTPPPAATIKPVAPPASESARVEAPKPLIVEIESVARSFLEAPTRAEALNLVLDPDTAAARWDAWFGDKPYAAPGFEGVVGEPDTTGTGEGAVSVVILRTGDYKLAELPLVKRGGHLKVDWDAWVGWSEMTWQDFRAGKPAEPKLFRVVLSAVDYFNFEFRDDTQWSSYRLDSVDGAHTLYGYVPRTGELDQRLRPADPGDQVRWLLKLKFPPGATQENQVLIDEVVAEGWVGRRGEE